MFTLQYSSEVVVPTWRASLLQEMSSTTLLISKQGLNTRRPWLQSVSLFFYCYCRNLLLQIKYLLSVINVLIHFATKCLL